MNPHTGAVYESKDAAIEAGEDPEDIVEIEGEREALMELIEAAEQRAKSMGRESDKGLSKREIRRLLERDDG